MATTPPPAPGRATHEVTNQPPPLAPLKLFTTNRPLVEAVEREGAGWQGALLVRHAPPAVADAFCAGRLDPGAAGLALGTLPRGVDAPAIIARAMPVAA